MGLSEGLSLSFFLPILESLPWRERLVVLFTLSSLDFSRRVSCFSLAFLFLFLPSSKTRVSSSPSTPSARCVGNAHALDPVNWGPAPLFKNLPSFSSLPLSHVSVDMLEARIMSDLEAPVASSHLSRNWRWWAFAPFAAAAMRAGQEPTERCRSGKSVRSLG